MNESRVARDVVVLGGSAGALAALKTILGVLPARLPATLAIVMHRSATFESQLAALLGRICPLPVREPADGEAICSGHVYIAPRDVHMTVDRNHWRLTRGPKLHWLRPAVDPLFTSAAAHYGKRVVGTLLSGGGWDGVSGLLAIKSAGGLSIAQDPTEAPYDSMPMHAILDDHVDSILRAAEIAAAIPALVKGQAYADVRRVGSAPGRIARSERPAS
jgi:two-component system chemotaxis response regulator CheB